jgi:preprotein translocase subunit SecF
MSAPELSAQATKATGLSDPTESGSLFQRLYTGRTNYEFVRNWRRWAMVSGAVILIGLIALLTKGLSFGIDFKGGTEWEVQKKDISVEQARDLVDPLVDGIPVVQIVGGDRLRIKGTKSDAATRDKVSTALAKEAGVTTKDVSVSFVGPSWGQDVSKKARQALIWFFIVIAGFISLRFEWKMAISALAAVLHDIFITVSIYALTGFEVTPATVIAFLTILGFSLYDTIVVFDKVNDNGKHFGSNGRLGYTDIVNLSMNQVLMRSLNTSFLAILPILSLLVVGAGFLGASALTDFALALLIGLVTGAYSSIFVASPLLAFLKEREPAWAAVRKKLAKGGDALSTDDAKQARLAAAQPGGNTAEATPATLFPGAVPRPRKQGKTK